MSVARNPLRRFPGTGLASGAVFFYLYVPIVVLRGLSMVASDQEVIDLTGRLFDGLYEHRRRALLLGKDPA